MNSRQTAAIFGGEPNGHWKATDASLVPLIRMSNTVFDAGSRPAEDILKSRPRLLHRRPPDPVDRREPRELPHLGAQVYEIRNGELGQLYRDGGIAADSRDYLMNVDAVGSDFGCTRSRTAARASRCRPSASATAGRRCGAARGSSEAERHARP